MLSVKLPLTSSKTGISKFAIWLSEYIWKDPLMVLRLSSSTVAPAGSGTGSAAAPGDDPKAKREEADYYSLLSAHLNRKKRYPSEAKKARQQGVVTVRFTVHADGRISGSSIRTSSGHDLLDQATLDLMERVAPLPRFPRSMTRDRVTISLPIDYSLRTK